MNNSIAITGIGCRFPGGADSAESFWKLLGEGFDAVTEVPASRWPVSLYYDPERGRPGKTYSKWGAFLEKIDEFDAGFFGITDSEATMMDPQQRLMLEVAWEAMEDAGFVPGEKGDRVGIFIGASTRDYELIQASPHDFNDAGPFAATGLAGSIIANRISYLFDFTGPSLVVDTACSSSLLAVHLACQSLAAGECRAAIAGGVNCLLAPDNFIAFSGMGLLSPDGRCRSFDARANGFVRGEGAGAILLRPLADALADRAPIYAVIRGTQTNQDGETPGIAFPNRESQASLIRGVLGESGVSREDLVYVEAHGTGTVAGDRVEASALGEVLGSGRPPGRELLIGSVKSNIGHLESGAGIAGIIKCALCLRHGAAPASLHFKTPNPAIDFTGQGLKVAEVLSPFMERAQRADGAVFAGVNSFSFGGSNVFALLQSHDPAPAPAIIEETAFDKDQPSLFLPLSARSPEALVALASGWSDYLGGCEAGASSAPSAADLVSAASMRRLHHTHRLGIVGRSLDDFRSRLDAFKRGEPGDSVFSGACRPTNGLVFVFSGQGAQWHSMGRVLFEREAVFRATFERCHDALGKAGGFALVPEFLAASENSRIMETGIAQPLICALQIALSAQLDHWGIRPSAVVGHSVGEVAAAHLAGVFDLEEAMALIFHRAAAMEMAVGDFGMLAVGLSDERSGDLDLVRDGTVCIAAVNSPGSVTLAGPREALRQLAEHLGDSRIWHRHVPVNYGFHSRQMDPLREMLMESLENLSPKTAVLPLYSTVTGDRIEGSLLDRNYWWRNVRERVSFASAIAALARDGYADFVEVAAAPVLSYSVVETLRASLPEEEFLVTPTLQRERDDHACLLESAARLYCAGYPIHWGAVAPPPSTAPVKLPRYPWQRGRHWRESAEWSRFKSVRTRHPLLMDRMFSSEPVWRSHLGTRLFPYLNDHAIQGRAVFPAAGYLEMAVAASSSLFPGQFTGIEQLELERALFVPGEGKAVPLETRYSSEDRRFEIWSNSGNAADKWVRHARGVLSPNARIRRIPGEKLDAVRERCVLRLVAEQFYAVTQQSSFHYGPQFRVVREVRRRDGEVIGEIELPDTIDLTGYTLHPVALDACLQMAFVAMDETDPAAPVGMFLPYELDRFTVLKPLPRRFVAHARMIRQGRSMFELVIRAFDEQGEAILELDGLRYRPLEGSDDANFMNWFYYHRWIPKPLPVSELGGSDRRIGGFSPLAILMPPLRETAAEFPERFRLANWFGETREDIERCWRISVASGLREAGWNPAPGSIVSAESVISDLDLNRDAIGLVRRCLRGLGADGFLEPSGNPGSWKVSRDPSDIPPASELWRSLQERFPSIHGELVALRHAAEILPQVLDHGQASLVSRPEEMSRWIQRVRESGMSWLPSNLLIREAVASLAAGVPHGVRFRILEVEAARGGLFPHLAAELPPHRARYLATDSSPSTVPGFVDQVERSGHGEVLRLDPRRDPFEQGLSRGECDLIVAQDLFSAGDDVGGILRNLRNLLAPGGYLIFSQPDADSWMADLQWTLVREAGAHEFAARPEDPSFMDHESWEDVLLKSGYAEAAGIHSSETGMSPGRGVFIARNATGSASAEEESPCDIDVRKEAVRSWLILADRGGMGERLGERLKERGDAVEVVSAQEAATGGFEKLSDGRPERIIHLGCLDLPRNSDLTGQNLATSIQSGTHGLLGLVRAVEARETEQGATRLLVVTRSSQRVLDEDPAVELATAPLLGMLRVVANELPRLSCRMIDLGAGGDDDAVVEDLLREFNAGDGEPEVALRGPARYVPRLERAHSLDSSEPGVRGCAKDLPARLVPGAPGMLNQLRMRPLMRRDPGPGEIEIEIRAACLNFRDVMKALGIYPGNAPDANLLGDEFAGVIVRTGPGVRSHAVGDRVFGVHPGSMATHLTVREDACIGIPGHMTFEEASTMPVAFLTAHHALHDLARVRKGERILIHSGAGGVGLATIHLALAAGLEVYATAGSPMKRQILRSMGVFHVANSRTLEFADEILALTGGEGVDVVLNSLSGEAIPRSLGILREYGRFLEIGKRDIYAGANLNLRPFRNSLSYFAIDLSRLIGGGHEETLLTRMRGLLESGLATPLPYRVFTGGDEIRAFLHMAQGHHTGKVVLGLDLAPILRQEAKNTSRPLFRGDVTYLITGGLKGLGLFLAEHLSRRGARHLMLTSLSGEMTGESERVLARIRAMGVEVEVRASDVSSPGELSGLLAGMRTTMPPLGGVIHAATIYHDALLKDMTPAMFETVMDAKAYGAWNLHLETLDDPLEFFVMISSISSVVGNPGQSNYAAANAFLESLAHFRRRNGLPALAIQLDRLTDVGYASRSEAVGGHFDRLRWAGISGEQAAEGFDRLLANHFAVGLVTSCTWRKGEAGGGALFGSPRFTNLVRENLQDEENGDPSGLRQRLESVPPRERRGVVAGILAREIAAVLRIAPGKIPFGGRLKEMGLDSLMAVELIARLEIRLGVAIPAQQISDATTVSMLSDLVLSLLGFDAGSPQEELPART